MKKAGARIAELEAQIAKLKAALAEKEKSSPAATPTTSAKPEVSYELHPSDDNFRFLNFGACKHYIQAERNQLHAMISPLYEPAFSLFHRYILPPHASPCGSFTGLIHRTNYIGS